MHLHEPGRFCCVYNRIRTRKGDEIMFFRKKPVKKTFDKQNCKPAIRTSICTGEQVAGFRNIHTGRFEEVSLITSGKDLQEFRDMYDIEGEIETFY